MATMEEWAHSASGKICARVHWALRRGSRALNALSGRMPSLFLDMNTFIIASGALLPTNPRRGGGGTGVKTILADWILILWVNSPLISTAFPSRPRQARFTLVMRTMKTFLLKAKAVALQRAGPGVDGIRRTVHLWVKLRCAQCAMVLALIWS